MPVARVWQAWCEDDGWKDEFTTRIAADAALSRHRKSDHAGKNCRICGLDQAGHNRRNSGKPGPITDPHDFQPGRIKEAAQ
jgi:hypothetical protein